MKYTIIIENEGSHNALKALLDSEEFQSSSIELVGNIEKLPWYSELIDSGLKTHLEKVLDESIQLRLNDLQEYCPSKSCTTIKLDLNVVENIDTFLSHPDRNFVVKECDPNSEIRKFDLKIAHSLKHPCPFLKNKIQQGGKVLVPLSIDGKEEGFNNPLNDILIEQTKFWANRFNLDPLFVHCWELIGREFIQTKMETREYNEMVTHELTSREKSMKDYLASKNYVSETFIREGDPSTHILDIIAETHPSLVIMGSHSTNRLPQIWLGSTAETILRKSPNSLFIIK